MQQQAQSRSQTQIRRSWFVGDAAPADSAAWRTAASASGFGYDTAPKGNAAAFDFDAGRMLGTVDERGLFDANTHPEYIKWVKDMSAARATLQAQEAAYAASADVAYDMEGRAFGVPRAIKPGTELREWVEFTEDGGRVAPAQSKSFWYAVDSKTGLPTSGTHDPAWAPTGKAAELDDFVRRTTQPFSASQNLVSPSTWTLRPGVLRPVDAHADADEWDALLHAGSARIAALSTQAAQAQTQAQTQTQTQTQARAQMQAQMQAPSSRAMRLALSSSHSTVGRPNSSEWQSVANMNEAASRDAAEYRQRFPEQAQTHAQTHAHAPLEAQPPRKVLLTAPVPAPAPVPVETLSIPECMLNSMQGACYDLSHWSELPTASQGVLPTLQFVATRDNRGPYLSAWIGILIFLLLLTCFVVAFASPRSGATCFGTSGSSAAGSGSAAHIKAHMDFSGPAWTEMIAAAMAANANAAGQGQGAASAASAISATTNAVGPVTRLG